MSFFKGLTEGLKDLAGEALSGFAPKAAMARGRSMRPSSQRFSAKRYTVLPGQVDDSAPDYDPTKDINNALYQNPNPPPSNASDEEKLIAEAYFKLHGYYPHPGTGPETPEETAILDAYEAEHANDTDTFVDDATDEEIYKNG